MRVLITSIVLLTLVGCKSTETKVLDLCKGELGEPKTRAAAYTMKFEPKYPQEAWENNIKGYVTLTFALNASGHTENIKVIESVPAGVFDQESVNALKRWRYLPKCHNGLLVQEPIETTFTFDGQGEEVLYR